MANQKQDQDLTVVSQGPQHRNRTERYLLPAQLSAFGTFQRGPTESTLTDAFNRWTSEIERLVGFPVSYSLLDEVPPPGKNWYVTFLSDRRLPRRRVEQAWRNVIGYGNRQSIKVTAYVSNGGGPAVSVNADGEECWSWHFIDNVESIVRRHGRKSSSPQRVS